VLVLVEVAVPSVESRVWILTAWTQMDESRSAQPEEETVFSIGLGLTIGRFMQFLEVKLNMQLESPAQERASR
jgi:hypothetical protein